MGAQYVDNHRIILYQENAAPRDITATAQGVQMRDDLAALARELTLAVPISPRDKYAPRWRVQPGDKVRVVNHDTEVFAGVVITASLDGQVTAYDRGWYLSESQIILQCAGVPAQDAIRQMCLKAGVSSGELCALATEITQTWVGATPADILKDILDTCALDTGKLYRYRVESGKLTVKELPSVPITAYHKPANNIAAFPITWALGQVSGEDTISGMRNAIVLAAENDGDVCLGAQAANATSIATYGFLQQVETVQPGDTAQLGQRAKNMLALSDRVSYTRSVDQIWGADEVQSGVALTFNSPAFGLAGLYRVTAVTHMYGRTHLMSLELSGLDEPRATDGEDSLQVWDIPAAFFESSGTGSGNAAAFVAAASGEVGYRETPVDINKYGAWAGSNGVAWCVYFVCWCADQAGAPIPTGYGFVGDMRDHFARLGKYHTVASGYIPKAGDLMIQGTRHIGIVESANRSAAQTIEGNCSNSVRRMTRYYNEISGFCAPF